MTDLESLYRQWTEATGELQPGVKRVFHEVLSAVEDGSMTTLVYGTDYSGEGTCLVNASAAMLTVGGGQGVPTNNFPRVVSLFDSINWELRARGVNSDEHVSPLAADILLTYYAPLDEIPTAGEAIKNLQEKDEVYIEPSDDEIREALLEAFSKPAPLPFDDSNDVDVSHLPDTIPELESIVDFYEE